MQYRIIPYSSIPHEEWDMFCDCSQKAWFWHRSSFLEYLSIEAENYSFALVLEEPDQDDYEIVAICPLIFRKTAFVDGYPLPMPITASKVSVAGLEMFWGFLYQQVESLGVQQIYCVRSAPVAVDWTATMSITPFGFRQWDTKCSAVVDLLKPAADRWLDLRKSYRALIKKDQRQYVVQEAPAELLPHCRKIHKNQRGSTRPFATWECMRQWLLHKEAKLMIIRRRTTDEIVGFSLVVIYKNAAYNAVMATTIPSISAQLLWDTIEYVRQCGVLKFEIGWQGMARSPKEEAIEFFRRGMGGQHVPLFIGSTLEVLLQSH